MPQTIKFPNMRCPECGNETAFDVDITATMSVVDGEWNLKEYVLDDSDSWTVCDECAHCDGNREFTNAYDNHHQDDDE